MGDVKQELFQRAGALHKKNTPASDSIKEGYVLLSHDLIPKIRKLILRNDSSLIFMKYKKDVVTMTITKQNYLDVVYLGGRQLKIRYKGRHRNKKVVMETNGTVDARNWVKTIKEAYSGHQKSKKKQQHRHHHHHADKQEKEDMEERKKVFVNKQAPGLRDSKFEIDFQLDPFDKRAEKRKQRRRYSDPPTPQPGIRKVEGQVQVNQDVLEKIEDVSDFINTRADTDKKKETGSKSKGKPTLISYPSFASITPITKIFVSTLDQIPPGYKKILDLGFISSISFVPTPQLLQPNPECPTVDANVSAGISVAKDKLIATTRTEKPNANAILALRFSLSYQPAGGFVVCAFGTAYKIEKDVLL